MGFDLRSGSPVAPKQPPISISHQVKSTDGGQKNRFINDDAQARFRLDGSRLVELSFERVMEGRTTHVNHHDDDMLDPTISASLPKHSIVRYPRRYKRLVEWAKPGTSPFSLPPPVYPLLEPVPTVVGSAPKSQPISFPRGQMKRREELDSVSITTFQTAQSHISHRTYHSASSHITSASGNSIRYNTTTNSVPPDP
jgi:hypothetical protein